MAFYLHENLLNRLNLRWANRDILKTSRENCEEGIKNNLDVNPQVMFANILELEAKLFWSNQLGVGLIGISNP
jgi:hypothetical protein